ncbi:MAG TPA: acetoacetate decarboxylase family protein [Acidimicrobiia bacterium]|jgi:acetoacetate decarboxylase|nr:acetoacetate decarboxylase family protein [Acidimicrobiia bacterium]
MPDYGLVAAEELGPTTPQLAPLYPALPWSMPGARIVKLAYEVGTDFVRHTLPAGLARSTPPYGTLLVYDVPESPFGPYRMAAQTLACRYRNFARVYVLQAVVDNPVALAALREVWSYPAAPGTVELADGDGEVRGLVAAPGGAALARFTLSGLEGAEAERVVIDGELTARVPPRFSTGAEEPVRLVQVNRAFALRDPSRARFSVEFTSAGDRYPWGAVPVTHLIIAVDTRADLEYAPTEHVLDYFPPT